MKTDMRSTAGVTWSVMKDSLNTIKGGGHAATTKMNAIEIHEGET